MSDKKSKALTVKIEEIRNLIEARRAELFVIWGKMRTLEESQEWRTTGAASFRQFSLKHFGIQSSEYEYYHAAHQFMTHDEMVAIGLGAVREFVKIMRANASAHKHAVPIYAATLISVEKYRSEHGYHPSKQTQVALVRNAAKQNGILFSQDRDLTAKEKYSKLVESLRQICQMGFYNTPPSSIGDYAESILIEVGHQPPAKPKAVA